MRLAIVALLAFAGCGGGDDDGPGGGETDAGVGGEDGGPATDAAPGTPVALDLAIDVEVGGSATSVLPASDPDGDALTWSIVEGPGSGMISSLDPATGAFTYETDVLVSGSDGFTFQITDGVTEPDVATVTVSIVPFVFTGDWELGAVMNGATSCTGGDFAIAHAPGHLDIGNRQIQCGGTTYTFDAIYAIVDGDDIYFNGVDVGDLADVSISMNRSISVPGCGTVTSQFALSKTAVGYTYAESASVPCGPDPNMTAAPAYTPNALLELVPQTHSLGSAEPGQAVTAPVTLMNIGKLTAGGLTAESSDAVFAFAGGAYPGVGGTCGVELAGRATCTMSVTASSDATGDHPGWLLTSYDDLTSYGGLRFHVHPPLTAPSTISIANNTYCALDGGAVECWGSSDGGRTAVPPLTGPSAVEVGNAHACAIDDTGVVCWGDGGGAPPPLTNPIALTAGDAHTCALHDGGVACWGDNSRGQSTVPALSNPVAVSAGGYHTCALHDGGVTCWGWNNIGQTTVPTLSAPVAVSAGAWHTCAVDASGLHCWGRNYDLESAVPSLTGPTRVSAGQNRTCAADASGLHCWGTTAGGAGFEPALTAPTALATEWDSACAIAGGELRCW